MNGYLRIALLVVVVIILLVMAIESRMRRRSLREVDKSLVPSVELKEPEFYTPVETNNTSVKLETQPALFVISVIAKPGQQFASYDLFQAISSAGMQFGEMNIFHYYLPTETGRATLFSLASITEPGSFNMDRMGDFSCVGLTLFMDKQAVADPAQAFELMLTTAQQLADDLDGELRAGQKQLWTDELSQEYRRNIQNEIFS